MVVRHFSQFPPLFPTFLHLPTLFPPPSPSLYSSLPFYFFPPPSPSLHFSISLSLYLSTFSTSISLLPLIYFSLPCCFFSASISLPPLLYFSLPSYFFPPPYPSFHLPALYLPTFSTSISFPLQFHTYILPLYSAISSLSFTHVFLLLPFHNYLQTPYHLLLPSTFLPPHPSTTLQVARGTGINQCIPAHQPKEEGQKVQLQGLGQANPTVHHLPHRANFPRLHPWRNAAPLHGRGGLHSLQRGSNLLRNPSLSP